MNSDEVIDLHAHLYPEGCFTELVKSRSEIEFVQHPDGRTALIYKTSHVAWMPRSHDDLKQRLECMDKAGIGVEVLSIGAVNIGWAGTRDASIARLVNDGLATACRRHPGRFHFAAALPCSSHAEMIQELDRALGLGAVCVCIPTTPADLPLDAPELRHFWHEMNRRKLTVLVHPTFPCDGPSNDGGQFLAVGYPGETAKAAARLALSGVLEECPDVRIVWSHLGGGLAMMLDRLDRGYQRFSSCPHPPSYYLRRCFYDTACTLGPALDCACATFGASQLVFGSDEPHVPNASKDVVTALHARPWPSTDVQAVVRENALGLLALEQST